MEFIDAVRSHDFLAAKNYLDVHPLPSNGDIISFIMQQIDDDSEFLLEQAIFNASLDQLTDAWLNLPARFSAYQYILGRLDELGVDLSAFVVQLMPTVRMPGTRKVRYFDTDDLETLITESNLSPEAISSIEGWLERAGGTTDLKNIDKFLGRPSRRPRAPGRLELIKLDELKCDNGNYHNCGSFNISDDS
jgi:hypothetical protein